MYFYEGENIWWNTVPTLKMNAAETINFWKLSHKMKVNNIGDIAGITLDLHMFPCQRTRIIMPQCMVIIIIVIVFLSTLGCKVAEG